jgi:GlpG protein
MRQAGTITSKQDAERFANYLLSLGITSKLDQSNGQWAIWVHDENQVPRCREELELFQREPNDARYEQAQREAKAVRRETAEKLRRARKNYIDMRNEWASPWRRRPITVAMIGSSLVATLSGSPEIENTLYFSWPAISAGEVWRLVTPIFLHGGLLHLLFNMFMLYQLGTLIERRHGSVRYLAIVLTIALVSNLAQALIVGPDFVGMSGVVYGLFGYAWVRGRLDPTSGFYLRPDYVFMLMAWFVLCFLLASLHVANMAHAGGLATGAALGWLAHVGHRWSRNKNA